LYAELSTEAPKSVAKTDYAALNTVQGCEGNEEIKFKAPQIRAVLLVKLV
jgi:hypothetical protein